jgi:hypothetical protein
MLVALVGCSSETVWDNDNPKQPASDGAAQPGQDGAVSQPGSDAQPGSDGQSAVNPPWPVCAQATGEAKLFGGKGVDIIWFIDTSGSMAQETAWVQQNINAFATFIGTKNLDYRVIMVAQPTFFIMGICVPPPLGGPNCTNGPKYMHIKEKVGSSNGLEKLVETYPKWQAFLRPQTTKNFVAVTDDDSAKPASWFSAELAKLKNPGFPNGFVFHSIASFGPDPSKGCATGASYGKVYETLSNQTGGTKFKVCLQDWKPIFNSLAQSVIQSAKPPCSYKLPNPPGGQKINPKQVLVSYLVGGQDLPIMRVDNKGACGASKAFYYDDNNAPKVVVFCPAACSAMKGGKIKIVFGCLKDVG